MAVTPLAPSAPAAPSRPVTAQILWAVARGLAPRLARIASRLARGARPWVGFLAVALLSGCKSIDPELVRAMAGDAAHVHVRVTTLYGTIDFERRMDFAPFPPPPAAATNLVAEIVEALRRDSVKTPAAPNDPSPPQ